MNKRGFTMIELLAVIMLILALAALVSPNLIEIFNKSTEKSMKIQEKELKDAGLLYLEDYCLNPLDGNACALKFNNENYTYSGKINLSELIDKKYVETISLNEQECTGCVRFDQNEATAYLSCGEEYQTEGYNCNN